MTKRVTLALAGAAALALLPTGLAAAEPAGDPPAQAPDAGVRATASHYAQAAQLDRALDDDQTAGSYLDAKTGKLVVTVTSETAADTVRARGVRAERVERSGAQLARAMDALRARASIPGTSWGVDPRRNQVVAEADATLSRAELSRLRKAAADQGGAVRVTRVPGAFRQEVLGGDAIYGGGVRCSAAFNVARGGTRYFLTAGHCAETSGTWSASSGGPAIGQGEDYSYPGDDYALVRYTDGSSPSGSVNLYDGGSQDITSAADAVVGQSLQKSGSTTQVTSGEVTATDVTVNYGNGNIIEGLVRTRACSAGGDSGGAHFSGSTALGIHSGSSGCLGTYGSALHQPVAEALADYGVDVY
ncbi:S1 family peptidase [Streptomyces boncukensis]|uniref:S1 family peptidase n=1 Tax=Streptomyces boncukensis TaxID=2711219 RepID=UPI001F49DB29|nr:S1 family peptidase [Streptomyces boncukensis]